MAAAPAPALSACKTSSSARRRLAIRATLWTAGAHADWFPVKQLRFGLEAEWTGVQTAMNNQVVTLTKAVGARPTGAYTVKNLGVLTAFFRAQRNF